MFEEYKGIIDLDYILDEVYHYKYDPNNLEDFYAQDFVEMEGNGVTAMCWIKYGDNKYLFKPIQDAYINWWGELLSYQLAKELGIFCCKYRACKLGNDYGVITEMINKNDETLILGSEVFQEFFNQYPKYKKEIVSVLEDQNFRDLYKIPEHFLEFNFYDQQRHLFSHLNNLENVWSMLSDFGILHKGEKKFGLATLTQEQITNIMEAQTKMLLFDIISLQGDRHVNNWGILNDKEVYRPCPLFDNATSFGLGYNDMRARINDFRNQVMNYHWFRDDKIIQDYLYQASLNFTLSDDNNIDPMHKEKDGVLKVFDDFLFKSDEHYKSVAGSFLDVISDDNFSSVIDRTEKENGIIMPEVVRFYIESTMDFHSKYLGDVANKYSVRSSVNGK